MQDCNIVRDLFYEKGLYKDVVNEIFFQLHKLNFNDCLNQMMEVISNREDVYEIMDFFLITLDYNIGWGMDHRFFINYIKIWKKHHRYVYPSLYKHYKCSFIDFSNHHILFEDVIYEIANDSIY